MTYNKIIAGRTTFLGAVIFLMAICGCDKIPFFSKFFPSLKKEEAAPAAIPAPLAPAPVPEALPANVLARVGTWTLTVDEFKEKLKSLKEVLPDFNTQNPQSQKLVLGELVNQQLLVQDAEENGLAKRKDILDAVDEFRRTILVREAATKITEGIGTVDTEVQDYYNKNKNDFRTEAQRHLREILIPTQQEANDILIELLKGADFATMAQTHSKSSTAVKGGDMGFVKQFKFPQMESAVATLSAGGVSSVFQGPDGYYIVKLEEKKGGEPMKLEEVKDEIKAGLTLNKQQQKVLSYIDELRKKTTVEIHEELLGK